MELMKKISIRTRIETFFKHSVSMNSLLINSYTLHEEELFIPISKEISTLTKEEQEEIFDIIADIFNKKHNDQEESFRHVVKKLDKENYPYFEAFWLIKTECAKCHEINVRTRMQFLRLAECLQKITLPVWKIDRGEGKAKEEGVGWKKFNNPRELTRKEKIIKIIEKEISSEDKASQIMSLR